VAGEISLTLNEELEVGEVEIWRVDTSLYGGGATYRTLSVFDSAGVIKGVGFVFIFDVILS
jgi:hypothetical protein